MPVVRYAALAALVFWLGGMTQALAGDLYRHMTLVALASGAIILVSLFVMKFVGPPPHAFVLRAALAAVMIAAAAAPLAFGPSRTAQAVTLGLGLVLLGWHARE
jgi:branched-subunit amino acid ABC-type transport system permease component